MYEYVIKEPFQKLDGSWFRHGDIAPPLVAEQYPNHVIRRLKSAETMAVEAAAEQKRVADEAALESERAAGRAQEPAASAPAQEH